MKPTPAANAASIAPPRTRDAPRARALSPPRGPLWRRASLAPNNSAISTPRFCRCHVAGRRASPPRVTLYARDLRAITVHELYRHSARLRRRSHAMGLDPRGGDLPAGVEAVYSSIRHAFQRAAAGELRRCVDIERWLRARGRRPPGRGPVHEWKDRWVSPGFCELDGLVCTQTLLPASSPALPPSPP